MEVKQFDLDQIVIGQQAEVQLDLAGAGVSPIHCLIERRDSGYYLCDLGSQTGTFKNDQAVLDEPLASGDEIRIGPYKLSFFVGVPKPRTTPPPMSVKAAPPPPPTPAAPVAKAADIKTQSTPPPATSKPGGSDLKGVPSAPPPKVEPKPEVKPQPAPSKKPEAPQKSEKAPVKPSIRSAGAVKAGKDKSKRTFAPPSEIRDLREHLKPGKGNVLEVIVSWRERVIETYHFRNRGAYKIGPGDRDSIRVASASLPRNFVLLDVGNAVKVNVTDAMDFELISTAQGRRKLEECVTTGKASRTGTGTAVRLDQNEMIYLGLGDINIFIRYAPAAPVVPLLPSLGLSGVEFSGLVMSLVMTGLLAFYISATTPKDLAENPQEEILHTAQVIFNNPPEKPPEPPPPPPPPPEKPPEPVKLPPPEKAKQAEEKKELQKKGKAMNERAKKAEQAGRASEVAPIPNSQNRPKKFTSTKQGGAVKIGEKAGSNANSTKDLSKVGLFSAFGGGGVRKSLDTAYAGAGEVLGQADKATGSTGFGENRAGDDLGSKFKDTGAGGKGTATQGIAGIGTKGRGSGQAAYGSADGLGAKTVTVVEPGANDDDFIGTIDKEAIRRRVKHYLHEIRGCYTRELNRLEKGQKLEGKVVISWEIIAQGAARNVQVKSSTINNRAVENCIRDRLASWSFPEPPSGMTAEVSYPFYLRQEN